MNNNNIDLHSSLKGGVGENIEVNKPFILVSQHPVTTEFGEGEDDWWNYRRRIDRRN